MASSVNYAQNVWSGRNFANPANAALPADPESGGLLRLGFGLLLIDTFLAASRALEIVKLDVGLSLPYVAMAIHVAAFGLALITGGARRLGATRVGIFLLLYSGWMIVCAPFSSWRTGSVETILNVWMPSMTTFLACGLLSSVRQCRRFGSVLAASGLTIAVASLALGTYKEQRFAFVSGTLGNANDLSMLLLLTAPFFLVPLFDKSAKKAFKYLAPAAGLLVLAMNFRTGSRAGLLAILAMLVMLFLTRSMMGKLKLAAAIVAAAAVAFAVIPSYSLYRYTTIFSDSDSAQDVRTSETYGSSQLRKELLQESIMVTLQHPLFGVGPGVFASATAKDAEREGKVAHWAVSHNTYTQVSSEMGIPGLIFYLGMIAWAYLDILWVRKHSPKDSSANAVALALLLSLAGLSAHFFFGSNAYMEWLPIVIGLAAALRFTLERDLTEHANAPATAAAIPPMPSPRPAPKKAYTYRSLGRPQRIRR